MRNTVLQRSRSTTQTFGINGCVAAVMESGFMVSTRQVANGRPEIRMAAFRLRMRTWRNWLASSLPIPRPSSSRGRLSGWTLGKYFRCALNWRKLLGSGLRQWRAVTCTLTCLSTTRSSSAGGCSDQSGWHSVCKRSASDLSVLCRRVISCSWATRTKMNCI